MCGSFKKVFKIQLLPEFGWHCVSLGAAPNNFERHSEHSFEVPRVLPACD